MPVSVGKKTHLGKMNFITLVERFSTSDICAKY